MLNFKLQSDFPTVLFVAKGEPEESHMHILSYLFFSFLKIAHVCATEYEIFYLC